MIQSGILVNNVVHAINCTMYVQSLKWLLQSIKPFTNSLQKWSSLVQNEMCFEVVVVTEPAITQVALELGFNSTLVAHMSLQGTLGWIALITYQALIEPLAKFGTHVDHLRTKCCIPCLSLLILQQAAEFCNKMIT